MEFTKPMRGFSRTVIASMGIALLLVGTSAAFAAPAQTLSMTATGGATDLATQVYALNGGQVAFAMIDGQLVNPLSATLQFSLLATQSGVSTRGTATIHLSGKSGGAPIGVTGTFDVNGSIPGAALPAGCTTNCQSEIPFFFTTGTSSVQETVGTAQAVPESLNIESPYWNPFGGPIVIASPDGAIFIVATYDVGTILWLGTQVGGTMTGTLGSAPASGVMSLTTGELENLVTGTARDAGTIQFSAMTPPSLDESGVYSGTSTIPVAGSQDCSSLTGFPQTCTLTGFQSSGQFTMKGVSGNYATTWGVPAYGFVSTITATVSQTPAPSDVSGRLNSGGSLCTSNGGSWVASTETCTIPTGAEWDVQAGTTLFIDSGVTLVNDGTIVNEGTVLNSGNIVNNGAITNDGPTFYNGNSGPTGTFTNDGVFTNEAGLTFNNFATFTNAAGGIVDNYGTFMNHTGGSTTNDSAFNSYGTTDTHTDTFYNFAIFADLGSANISNQGGSTLTNECGGQMVDVPNSEYSQPTSCAAGA